MEGVSQIILLLIAGGLLIALVKGGPAGALAWIRAKLLRQDAA